MQITGNYNGTNGDESSLPNFYDLFCNGTYGRTKPMIIGEVCSSSSRTMQHFSNSSLMLDASAEHRCSSSSSSSLQ
jgi:hypothetical protein